MLRNYIKLALKVLLRRKFFTFVSLFGIGFTLIVLMLATAMLDHTFGAHPPEGKLERTLGVHAVSLRGERGNRNSLAGFRFAERYMKDLPGVETMTLIGSPSKVGVEMGSTRSRSFLKRTDGEFWKVFDPKFIEGRPFTDEESDKAATVAVINEATRNRFFGSARAEGKFLDVDGQRFRIVGVVENVSFTRLTPFSDIWVPISTSRTSDYKKELVGNFSVVVVAKGREHFPAMRAELDRRLKSIPTGDAEFPTIEAVLGTPFETVASQLFRVDGDLKASVRRLQALMVIIALMFISLPTLNLVNVNLSRILERSSEIGVRKAFGASSRTLVGQFVIENVVLTLIGGVIGLIGSLIVLQMIDASGTIPYSDLSLNLRIFLYALGIALFFGVFSGVYPAWRMSRLHPVEALRGGTR